MSFAYVIKNIAFLTVFLCSVNNLYAQTCEQQKAKLLTSLEIANTYFASEVRVIWQNPDLEDGEIGNFLDAFMISEDEIYIQDPCLFSGPSLAYEAQEFILFHEFFHTIVDVHQLPDDIFDTFDAAEDSYFEIHHLNTDMIALKFMNFLEKDSSFAVETLMTAYQKKELESDYKNTYDRLKYLMAHIETSFETFEDLLPVVYLGGIAKLQKFLNINFPSVKIADASFYNSDFLSYDALVFDFRKFKVSDYTHLVLMNPSNRSVEHE